MNSYEDKLYIKIEALDVIYDFVVEFFFIWSHLVSQNLILNLKFQNL